MSRGRKKQTKDEEVKKFRPCLGPDCRRRIYTTKYIRLCKKCKRHVNDHDRLFSGGISDFYKTGD